MAANEIRKIMTKPLPQILDEIESSIGLADEAAKVARQAAVEARKAGEKAVEEATSNVSKRIILIEKSIEKGNVETNERFVGTEEAITKAGVEVNERFARTEKSIEKGNVQTNERFVRTEEALREQIIKVEQIATNALRLSELLKSALLDGVLAIDKKISETNPEIKMAPKPDIKNVPKHK